MGLNLGSVTFREEYSVWVSENRVLRKLMRLGGRKKQKAVEICIMKSFMDCKVQEIL